MAGNFFRGTTHDQDSRFSNKDLKLMQNRQWPKEFDNHVDLKKVDLGVIRPWINNKISDMLGFEDEIVINTAINILNTYVDDPKGPCPKQMQIQLTGFLERKSLPFMQDLWKLLLEAQSAPNGIPPSLINEKKAEYLQKKEELKDQVAKLENLKKKIDNQQPMGEVFDTKNIDKVIKKQSNFSIVTPDVLQKIKELQNAKAQASNSQLAAQVAYEQTFINQIDQSELINSSNQPVKLIETEAIQQQQQVIQRGFNDQQGKEQDLQKKEQQHKLSKQSKQKKKSKTESPSSSEDSGDDGYQASSSEDEKTEKRKRKDKKSYKHHNNKKKSKKNRSKSRDQKKHSKKHHKQNSRSRSRSRSHSKEQQKKNNNKQNIKKQISSASENSSSSESSKDIESQNESSESDESKSQSHSSSSK